MEAIGRGHFETDGASLENETALGLSPLGVAFISMGGPEGAGLKETV
jgi:hypothetical protein